MIAIRDGRSAVSQKDMMDAITRLDKKRLQGTSSTSPKPSILELSAEHSRTRGAGCVHDFAVG